MRPNLWFSHAWLVAALALCNKDTQAKQALEGFKKAHSTRSGLDWITKYYSEDQYQNPTAQAAVAQLLTGLRKTGVK